MIELIDYHNIRALHQDGWGIRRIARHLGHSRDTVRKALGWDGRPPKYTLSKARPRPAVTPQVVDFVKGILEKDREAPRKQRHTALQIHDRLVAELADHPVGESTARNLVRQLKKEMQTIPDVTLPLYFAPGEEAQVDWGEATVIMNGVEQVANFLIVTLCYSRRVFAMAFPSQKQEAFLETHVCAFEYFGGRTQRLAYDNLKAAVKNVLLGGREENETFLAFRGYYKFEARFCTPGEEGAHEKGRVERRVPLLRGDVFVPVPEVSSWKELNDRLLTKCKERDLLPHPEFRQESVLEVFHKEQAFLLPLPSRRFMCCRCESLRVDSQSQVRFEKAVYSMPCEYGRRRLDVRAFVDRVEFWDDNCRLVGTWPRSYTGGDHYDFRHYLPLLKKAPCGCLNGKPYLTMPEVLLKYRNTLLSQMERRAAGKALAQVLLLILKHPEKEATVLEAVELSLVCGTVDPNAVQNLFSQLLAGASRPPLPLDLSERPDLRKFSVAPPNLDLYNQLLLQLAGV